MIHAPQYDSDDEVDSTIQLFDVVEHEDVNADSIDAADELTMTAHYRNDDNIANTSM